MRSDERVLEVGFGGGYLLGRMSAIVTSGFIGGVDISTTMVEQGQARYRTLIQAGKMDLKAGTADRLPYPAAHFSKAVSVNSIFYWPDAAQASSELSRVLGEGGRLVLCFTDKDSLQQKDFAQHGLTLYGIDEVRQSADRRRAAGDQRHTTYRSTSRVLVCDRAEDAGAEDARAEDARGRELNLRGFENLGGFFSHAHRAKSPSA